MRRTKRACRVWPARRSAIVSMHYTPHALNMTPSLVPSPLRRTSSATPSQEAPDATTRGPSGQAAGPIPPRRAARATTARRTVGRSGGGRRTHTWFVLTVLLLSFAGSVDADEVSRLPPRRSSRPPRRACEAGDLSAAAEALLTLDDAERPGGPAHTRQISSWGFVLVRQGRVRRPRFASRPPRPTPLLGDYALYNLAQAQRSAGRRELAAEALRRLVAQHPQSVLARPGRPGDAA